VNLTTYACCTFFFNTNVKNEKSTVAMCTPSQTSQIKQLGADDSRNPQQINTSTITDSGQSLGDAEEHRTTGQQQQQWNNDQLNPSSSSEQQQQQQQQQLLGPGPAEPDIPGNNNPIGLSSTRNRKYTSILDLGCEVENSAEVSQDPTAASVNLVNEHRSTMTRQNEARPSSLHVEATSKSSSPLNSSANLNAFNVDALPGSEDSFSSTHRFTKLSKPDQSDDTIAILDPISSSSTRVEISRHPKNIEDSQGRKRARQGYAKSAGGKELRSTPENFDDAEEQVLVVDDGDCDEDQARKVFIIFYYVLVLLLFSDFDEIKLINSIYFLFLSFAFIIVTSIVSFHLF